jgi:hypothetical protein
LSLGNDIHDFAGRGGRVGARTSDSVVFDAITNLAVGIISNRKSFIADEVARTLY